MIILIPSLCPIPLYQAFDVEVKRGSDEKRYNRRNGYEESDVIFNKKRCKPMAMLVFSIDSD